MVFGDDLRQIAADYIAATKKKEKEDAAFRAAWEQVRRTVILAAFETSKKELSPIEEELGWSVSNSCENGSIVLKLHHPDRQFVDELRFSADVERRMVNCTSSVSAFPEEKFELRVLQETPAVVDKVTAFVKIALKAPL